MKTVYRQDGSAVELSEVEAAAWVKRGLATYENPAPVVKAKPVQSNQGASK